jgi:pyruvate dehydrogenase E1 component beta subunit
MAIECLRAAKILEKQVGIKAEVIAPVSLKPLYTSYIEKSVKKTQCLIVVDNSWIDCGLGAEIISRLHEKEILNFKSARMGFAETVCPTSPSIEKLFYPDPVSIAKKACEMLGYLLPDDNPVIEREEIEFKGPF